MRRAQPNAAMPITPPATMQRSKSGNLSLVLVGFGRLMLCEGPFRVKDLVGEYTPNGVGATAPVTRLIPSSARQPSTGQAPPIHANQSQAKHYRSRSTTIEERAITTPPDLKRSPKRPGIERHDTVSDAARKTLRFHFNRMLQTRSWLHRRQ